MYIQERPPPPSILSRTFSVQGECGNIPIISTSIIFSGFFGTTKKWEAFSRLPSQVTVRRALSRYLDITSAPSPQILKFLATMVSSSPLFTGPLSRVSLFFFSCILIGPYPQSLEAKTVSNSKRPTEVC